MAESRLLEVLFTVTVCSLISLSRALPCSEICSTTFSKADMTYQVSCCQRGCRLFAIMEFMTDFPQDKNSTNEMCVTACSEAYAVTEKRKACFYGCLHQESMADKLRSDFPESPDTDADFLYPLLYVHSLYSNMFDKVRDHMTVQWSMFMQRGNGQLIVIQSVPQQMFDDTNRNMDDLNTPVGLETNLLPVERGATPESKRTQLRSVNEDGIPIYAVDSNNFQSSDWLSCISGKTGLPRLILTGLVLLSAWVMIWLCLTAAHTAPDHHVKAEKLSINGDVEYLKEVEIQKILTSLYPQDPGQDPSQALALPIKIRVQRI